MCLAPVCAGGFLPVVEGLDAAGLQGEALRVVLDGPVEAVQLPAARCVTMWAIKAVQYALTSPVSYASKGPSVPVRGSSQQA